MIKITKELLNEWFDEFNAEFFNGELRKTSFVITNNVSRFGQFRPRTWTIEISTACVRTERDYKNTFIHECCHCYVRQKYGHRVQSHGYEWKEIANRINRQMCGKYGTIQRVGGGQDKSVIRDSNAEKFVAFTDYNGNSSIAKYRDDGYVAKLKRMGCIKSGTKIYYLVSSDNEMARYRFRKVNTNSVRWNYETMGFAEVLKRSDLIKEEDYTKLNKVA